MGGNGRDEYSYSNLPPIPYTQPMFSNSYKSVAVHSQAGITQPQIHGQAPLFQAQASQRFRSNSYDQRNTSLPASDRAFLAEPEGYRQWQRVDDGSRLSLPLRTRLPEHFGHEPQFSGDVLRRNTERRPLQYDRGPPLPQQPQARSTRCAYTPPPRPRATSSSLSNGLPSSPSFNISQRRSIQSSHINEFGTSHGLFSPPSASLAHFQPTTSQQRIEQGQVSQHSFPSAQLLDKAPIISQLPSSLPPCAEVQNRSISLSEAPPVVQGIQLVSPNELSDRFRSVFPFQLFNAVQSKCYNTLFKTNDNLVLSAPTGSGKTAVLEMAICQLVSSSRPHQFKIIYMAPTKSLCSERQRDWHAKFTSLDLQCAELTGDTDQAQLRHVQSASIVITTPEKWDSVTRKWKDHGKLLQLVKLFLIDEVHILKDTRGATLEAVVSRMKSVGSNVRFVALSATVPNSHDIATWLGKDAFHQHLPAQRERFGEEFRPVKLQKFVYGLSYQGNDFGFEKVCDAKLPDIIAKHSQNKKPIMVFCATRKSTVSTARLLANIWATKGPRDRGWPGPSHVVTAHDADLRGTLASGVACHHAGLDIFDRHAVEKGYLEGQISVICSTSTLAVGVNLPCHLVIIKNTVCYQEEGLKEYADLEMMQMLGRAGRPQYDDSAIAVIITKQEKVKKYEKMVSGEELLESCLHLNLIDHLNAEIGLGTIYDLRTAKNWLAGTFLYVRLGQNPDYYKLNGDATDQNLDDRIQRVCQRDIGLLQDNRLVSSASEFRSTEFGDAMARYYVKFETMVGLLSLQPRSKISDILSILVGGEEFYDIRLRADEKKLYKELNTTAGIKYPIKVDIALSAHKRSLIIQAELGGVEFPVNEQYAKHRRQFVQEKAIIFSSLQRLIRCVIDCQIHLQDGVTTRHALELARSFGAHVWDNSPHQMKQLPQIGPVAIRKLAAGGINTLEALEATEPHRIEMLMSKNPPFGNKILASLKDFPKLRVSVRLMGKGVKSGQLVNIKFKAECGFLNERVPIVFQRKPIYICLLAERSDGHLVDFRRISAKRLNNGQDILMSADLANYNQYITCYVLCDDIAGTLRFAELRPNLPASLFPSLQNSQVPEPQQQKADMNKGGSRSDVSKQRANSNVVDPSELMKDNDFSDEDLNDEDIADAVDAMDFSHIDTFDSDSKAEVNNSSSRKLQQHKDTSEVDETVWSPKQFENGKWACNHKCKNKASCKHMCCREGVDKAPKPPKGSALPTTSSGRVSHINGENLSVQLPVQSKLQIGKTIKPGQPKSIEKVDLSKSRNRDDYAKNGPRDYRSLHRLHESPSLSFASEDQHRASPPRHTRKTTNPRERASSDYDNNWMDDLPSPTVLLAKKTNSDMKALGDPIGGFDDDISDLENGMIGLSDPITLNNDLNPQVVKNLMVNRKGDRGINAEKEQDLDSVNLATLPPLAKAVIRTGVQSGVERLFLSTDSPEKPTDLPKKRRATSIQELDGTLPDLTPTPKKRRLDASDPASQKSPLGEGYQASSLDPFSETLTKAENQPLPTPKIRPGQPAWVYEFDPAFIAEYQDFLEFV